MTDFWEDPERVEQFAERDPDHRLRELLDGWREWVRGVPPGDPGEARVLDLGCAGGRNTELLARAGFEVHALDASTAMVERTRSRLAGVVGRETARERVRRGRMDALPYGAESFLLVVALGVHHSAESWREWERAADETARVLASGGLLLFNQFTPEADLTGEGVRPVPGERGVYEGFPAGRVVLLDASALDAEWGSRGLRPEVESETVRVELEPGRRVSVNALYRKE